MIAFVQGTHKSLKGNQNAKATVTAIIDGTGSIGAALGPLIFGLVVDESVSHFDVQEMLSAIYFGCIITELRFGILCAYGLLFYVSCGECCMCHIIP